MVGGDDVHRNIAISDIQHRCSMLDGRAGCGGAGHLRGAWRSMLPNCSSSCKPGSLPAYPPSQEAEIGNKERGAVSKKREKKEIFNDHDRRGV